MAPTGMAPFRWTPGEPSPKKLRLQLPNLTRHRPTRSPRGLLLDERGQNPLERRLDDVEERLRVDSEDNGRDGEREERQRFLAGQILVQGQAAMVVVAM